MPAPKTAAAKPSNNLAAFRSTHDPRVAIPAKIDAALADMRKMGREYWEYELDFTKRVGINFNTLAPYREQFSAHIVVAKGMTSSQKPRLVWFGDKKAASAARG